MELGHLVEALTGRLRQGPRQHGVHGNGQAELGSGRRGQARRLRQVCGHEIGGGRALERRVTAEHLDGHHRQRVLVRAGVQRQPADLFGRHVARRAQGAVVLGDRVAGLRGGRRLCESSQAEVQQLHEVRVTGGAREQHVRGLQIAVDDALLVGVGHCARDLPQDAQRGGHGERPRALQALGERLAAHVLHCHVWHGGAGDLRLAEPEHHHQVGVEQTREHPRFALETGTRVRSRQRRGVQQLHRHRALEQGVLREQHLPDAAGAEGSDQLVLSAQPRAGRQRRRRRR
jgi:hypothetical protein